ncbi:MAG: hypothetical protein Tsb0014_35630 [Pleurocapsa sp.]
MSKRNKKIALADTERALLCNTLSAPLKEIAKDYQSEDSDTRGLIVISVGQEEYQAVIDIASTAINLIDKLQPCFDKKTSNSLSTVRTNYLNLLNAQKVNVYAADPQENRD